MSYYLDLEKFTLEMLENRLKNSRVLPSQKVLLEDLENRFNCIQSFGLQNLADLQEKLKTKKHVQDFSEESSVPLEFLTVLRREINSYQPKPIHLKEFPGVDLESVRKLEAVGIKNTKQLFPFVQTAFDRKVFSCTHQISEDEILDLTKLTDVARIKWVGPKFARLLVETTFDSVQKVANADPEALFVELMRVNDEKRIYKGNLGKEDLAQWINTVQDVPQVIEY
ncbi:MAG: DUF4332 domain-containing protein [Anaerolineaceae bacterium]|nr:DUF4332 domain-containing protein [Anaerolineaceae bacterium]